MLNFGIIQNLRDKLIQSLVHWRSSIDGFYRSSPIVKVNSPPSFTNTGIVLQAFNESGQNHLSQALADSLLAYLKKRDYAPFPHEKATTSDPKSHVMCNSWPVFSVLDCYPNRFQEFERIYSWFLQNQNKENGSWDLLPGEETRYPIFSAYVLSVLLQHYDCCRKMQYSHNDLIKKVKEAMMSGFDYLISNRASNAIKNDLLLWPTSLNEAKKDTISFGTSVTCMHMFAKAARMLGNEDWEKMVENTFLNICNSFNHEDEENFTVGGMKLNIWDQIHVNESSLNYFFGFFAPANLTTLLRFSTSPLFKDNPNYYYFICHLTNWIIENESHVDGRPGIRGSKFIDEVKVWSTAYAVIVLSRILNQGYRLLHLTERIEYEGNDMKIIQAVNDILKISSPSEKSKKKTRMISNFLVVCFCATIWIFFEGRIQENWFNIEGKVWLGGTLVTIVLAFIFGLNLIPKVREKIFFLINKINIRLTQIHKLENLYNKQKNNFK